MIYRGEKTKEISFPLGGIGTGCIGLAGNGSLVDWEIFNKPNKGSRNGFTHFAVRAESGGKVLDVKAVMGDELPPYTGLGHGDYNGFGFGISRNTLQGLPHFVGHEFVGEFPMAEVRFKDKTFPGTVRMNAFNPFIPLNDRDSTIPAAFFEFEITNTTSRKITYTVFGVVKNPHTVNTVNEFIKQGKIKTVKLYSSKYGESSLEYGDVTVATDADSVSFQEYWYRGGWFDNLEVYWHDITRPGKLANRRYDPPSAEAETKFEDHATLAAHVDVGPKQTRTVRFVISWNYPNMTNYWNAPKCDCGGKCPPNEWKNYYATLFKDSTATAEYALSHWDRLAAETRKFKNALFASTLPDYVLDAISANISILKSPTVLRLPDGSVYGFEGCSGSCGCCEGSCTHVWAYSYAMAYLFPNLERSMRDLEYRYSMRDDGKMGFRLQLPVGREFGDWHAAADGQFATVLRAYREWKICGDDSWLKSNWEAIKKSIDFAWSPSNEDKWDLDKDGVLEGRQHHTLDIEFFGPNSFLTGLYLGALKAGAEMADYFGENAKAGEYRVLFEKGKAWVDKNLFNGEYYHQKVAIKDKSVLAPYKEFDGKFGSIESFYWSDEHGQLKYQVAEGCHCDQVIAQWHANMIGLGEIFDRRQVKKALKAIYKYNFKKSLRNYFNACRIYALNDEAALVICTWPKGNKPAVPVPYAEEAMNGFEYQAAIHMIQEGLIKEGLEVVKGVRDRYNGQNRNPWNEFECGSNYARSMASYALLPTLSGFTVDMVKKHIGFAPMIHEKNFSCFWSIEGAWGTYKRSGRKITLKVESGELQLRQFSDSLLAKTKKVKTSAGSFTKDGQTLTFDTPLLLKAGQTLTVG